VDAVAASGLVLTQVGYNTGMRPVVQQRDAAIVIGDGMVGHWTAQTLQARGAKVLLIGRHDERLKLLTLRNGDRVVNEKEADVLSLVREWAPEGAQAVCDTVGTIDLLENLIPLMRHGGHISSAGFYGANGRIDIQKLRDRELTLHAPAGWNKARMDATLEMLASGELHTKHLISHRFRAAQAGEAFDLILSRREPVLGVVLDWEL
jgi:2-desacetyl-2-hydroxyethyl bacteriochlorophyllide A dehydrogenase